MKKLLLIGFLFISFVSCNNIDLKNPKYQNTSAINNQINRGMTIDNFLLIAGERAEKTADYRDSYHKKNTVVYKIYQYDKNDKAIRYTTYIFREFYDKKNKSFFSLQEYSTTEITTEESN